MGDFILDSEGHCFLCADLITTETPPDILVTHYHYVNYLFRYLKMDTRKVFNKGEGTTVLPQLLAKLEKVKVKVELCDDCLNLSETFSKLYKKLERIEMEVKSCVELIHKKFLKAKEVTTTNKRDFYNYTKDGFKGKAEIVEILRTDGRKKCANMLRNAVPQLVIKRITVEEINKEMGRSKLFEEKTDEFLETEEKAEVFDLPHCSDNEDKDMALDMSSPTSPRSPCEDADDNADLAVLDPGSDSKKIGESNHRTRPLNRCSDCCKTFSTRKSLEEHQRQFHPDPKEGDDVDVAEEKETEMDLEDEYNQLSDDNDESDSEGSDEDFNDPSTKRSATKPEAQTPKQNQISKTTRADSVAKPIMVCLPGATSKSTRFTFDPKTRRYKCGDCSKELKYQIAMKTHCESIHQKIRYVCKVCGKEFRDSKGYKIHHQSAHAGIRHHCPTCHSSFTTKTNLRKHQLYCGTGVSRKYPTEKVKCPNCEKEFRKDFLQTHIKAVHLKERPHLCSQCGKGFFYEKVLTVHVNSVHLNLREHMCDICGKGFKRKDHLTDHRLKVHLQKQ